MDIFNWITPLFREVSYIIEVDRITLFHHKLVFGARAINTTKTVGTRSRVVFDGSYIDRRWKNGYRNVIGVYHTHPYGAGGKPSLLDVLTGKQWVKSLGRPFIVITDHDFFGNREITAFAITKHNAIPLDISPYETKHNLFFDIIIPGGIYDGERLEFQFAP